MTERDIEILEELIYESQENIIKRRKIGKKIKAVLYYIFLALIIPLSIFTFISKLQNNVVYIGGKGMMVVASGSMSYKHKVNDYLITNDLNNQFNKFDIIILEEVNDTTDLDLYDVIAYRNDEGINIIHRIVEINSVNGVIEYVTRGDAVDVHDTYHPKIEDILGVYTCEKVKNVGIFILFLQSPSGIITLFAILYCILMIDKNSEKIKNAQYEREEVLNVAFDYDKEKYSLVSIAIQEFIYYYDEHGFKEKNVIEDYYDGVIVRELKNKQTNELTSQTIKINKEGD